MKLHMFLLLSFASLACTAPPPPASKPAGPKADVAQPRIDIDYQAKRVVCRSPEGKVEWSTPLDLLNAHRSPHLLQDAERVYVSHAEGIMALGMSTGKVLWNSSGPNHRLLLSRNLLLATDCTSGDHVGPHGRWLVARSVATGREVFRTRLPVKDFDPLPIREIAGLFLVQDNESPGGKGDALLIDHQGKLRYRFDRQVVDGKLLGKDRVFLTSKDVVHVSADGKSRWTIPLEHEWIAGGGLLEMRGGDLLVYLNGAISDSGVQLVRLDPKTGKVGWRTRCEPLGVSHSKYRHEAAVAVEGGQVKVVSQGSSGKFMETLDLKTGRRLDRQRAGAR